MVSYNPVNLKQHKSEALVVHCCDPRFQEAYRHVANQKCDFYDVLAVPGASKAIVDDSKTIDSITMLHGLHDFKAVYIMDHIECGAFGKIDDEVEAHSKYIHLAESKIKKALPDILVSSHLLGAKQEIALNV
jgi:hypothetical protein